MFPVPPLRVMSVSVELLVVKLSARLLAPPLVMAPLSVMPPPAVLTLRILAPPEFRGPKPVMALVTSRVFAATVLLLAKV